MTGAAAVPALRLRVNGSEREVRAGSSVAELVRELAGEARMVAVERNGDIVPRAEWELTPLGAGDRVEIVRFVQGG